MSKRGTIVNEWEKLNRISNRRLKYQSLTLPLKMQWSIDRITIVGKLKENIYYHTPNDVLILNFEQLMRLNEGNGYLKAVNPNKINQFLSGSMKNFIHDLFLEPHFSRADIACDIVDIPDDFVSQYRVVDPVSFKPIYGRSGKLETAYWGSRASERQIRMYNKKLEQERKRKIVPPEITTWWRLELQLRRGKATDWHEMVHESLDSFASPHYFPPNTKVTERIMVKGLLYDHSEWGNLAKNTKKKYRDLLKQESQNDELTNHLRESFAESADDLKRELDTWLQGLDVTEVGAE